MNTFEPGRIYRIKVNGIRMVCIQPLAVRDQVYTVNGYIDHGEITDVRGPLVVLDLDQLNEDEGYEFPVQTIVESMRDEQTITGRWIADQIEEQTRPPLQVGWHEVVDGENGRGDVMRWDGSAFYWPAGHAALGGGWTSTHYIGPGSGDAS